MNKRPLSFRIIIPTHNNRDTLERAVRSATEQDYPHKKVVVVDDCSDDGTSALMHEFFDVDAKVECRTRVFNGGARNVGMEYFRETDYTLFLDADDNFISRNVLSVLAGFIEVNNQPDMVRLPYIRVEMDGRRVDQTPRILAEKNIGDVARSVRVACWTKAVRTRMLEKFPEDTLMEDVCQHLRQCDMTLDVAWFPEPVVEWHIRENSTSRANSEKWKMSAFRFPYDLYTLPLSTQYAMNRRDAKLKESLKNLSEGRFAQ